MAESKELLINLCDADGNDRSPITRCYWKILVGSHGTRPGLNGPGVVLVPHEDLI
jgi:hypothetical protein